MHLIYDWDDTLQHTNSKSSFSIMIKTLFKSSEDKLINIIINSPTMCIITTRPKLYTFFIKLKCFMITKSFKCFSNMKIDTINPHFFFNGVSKKHFSDDKDRHLRYIGRLKSILYLMNKTFNHELETIDKIGYVDFDLNDKFIIIEDLKI